MIGSQTVFWEPAGMGKCLLSGITCRVERVDCQHCTIVSLYGTKAKDLIIEQLEPKEGKKVGKR